MNDTVFDQRIKAAFAVLPAADTYLKNRLLKLPDEVRKPAVARRLLPLAGALAVVVAIGIAIPMLGRVNPPQPPIGLPPIARGSMISSDGMAGMGYEAHMNKSAAELHRDAPAYGREGEIGTMAVYRNPNFGERKSLDEAAAMEIAEKFGRAVGKAYVSEPHWLTPEAMEQVREKLRYAGDTEEEIERVLREQFTQTDWQFKCGEETLSVSGYDGVRVSLQVPLPELPRQRIADPARYEALCQQVYENYAAAIEELTGLRFDQISTFTSYNIYGEIMFDTFFYANNPGDSFAKQAEDYAFKRLGVSIPFASEAEIADGYEEELVAWLSFGLGCPGAGDLLDYYPVMDLDAAKRELLDGNYESSAGITKEELSRGTVEEAELIYSDRPWLSTWMPMYRLYVSFPPEALRDIWGSYSDAHISALGLREYYVFYVPAIPPEYLIPQREDGGMPRPVG